MVKLIGKSRKESLITQGACLTCATKKNNNGSLCMICEEKIHRLCRNPENDAEKLCARILKSNRPAKRVQILQNFVKDFNKGKLSSDTPYKEFKCVIKKLQTKISYLKAQIKKPRKPVPPVQNPKKVIQKSTQTTDELIIGVHSSLVNANEFSRLQKSKISSSIDFKCLRNFLKSNQTTKTLENLTSIATKSSNPYQRGCEYKILTNILNDGFELCLGKTKMELAARDKNALINQIHQKCRYVSIKNCLIKAKQASTVMWFTLHDSNVYLKEGLMSEILAIQAFAKKHAIVHWPNAEEYLEQIKISKVDFCQDYFGSFLPQNPIQTFGFMKSTIQGVINQLQFNPEWHLLAHWCLGDLIVKKGDNQLDSCAQFKVFDFHKNKTLTIKVYDKMLDLIGREAHNQVGSRIQKILGSQKSIGKTESLARRAQYTGITRLEISIHMDQYAQTESRDKFIQRNWHERLPYLFKLLRDQVLNNFGVVSQSFRMMTMSHLLFNMGQLKQNLLLIGKKTSWLVLCRTSHKQHFVGTQKFIEMGLYGTTDRMWQRLHEFVIKYATPGAKIAVYNLSLNNLRDIPAHEIIKREKTAYQPPNCNMQCMNGVVLPVNVRVPFEWNPADGNLIDGWEFLPILFKQQAMIDSNPGKYHISGIATRVIIRRRVIQKI